MSEYVVILLSAIFSSNLIAVCGVGAVSLQSEKRNFVFLLITAVFQVLSIIIVGLIYHLFKEYVLIPLKAEYLKLFIIVCLSCVCAFISKYLIKAISKEQFFYYEKSYSLPIQTAISVGALMIINITGSIVDILYNLAMFSAGYLLVQIIFYSLYERLDNSYTLKPARNVPLMLYVLSIVSMVFSAVVMMFV